MKTIILVEDDSGIADATKLILQLEGYHVDILINGDGLLEDHTLPDLYILDVQLPGVSGTDICMHLKKQERSKHIPIILLSASPHILKIYKDACADIALEKPFPKDKL